MLFRMGRKRPVSEPPSNPGTTLFPIAYTMFKDLGLYASCRESNLVYPCFHATHHIHETF